MKKTRIIWGVGLVAVALLLILDACGLPVSFPADIPVWRVVLSVVLLIFAIKQAIKLRISAVFFPLTFIVMLFEKQIAGLCGIEGGDIASFGEFMLVALLLTVGTALLIPKRKLKKSEKVKEKKERLGCKNYYIDCSEKVGEYIENNFSVCNVYFTNADQYCDGGSLRIENNFGKVNIHIPEHWSTSVNVDSSFGTVYDGGGTIYPNSKNLLIFGENNFGNITVRREK